MPQFLLGVMAGLMLASAVVSTSDKGERCERTSGDNFWSRKKEAVPCPTRPNSNAGGRSNG